jgi:hypothetical protein
MATNIAIKLLSEQRDSARNCLRRLLAEDRTDSELMRHYVREFCECVDALGALATERAVAKLKAHTKESR